MTKINYGQSPVAKTYFTVIAYPLSLAIRTTMGNSIGHSFNSLFRDIAGIGTKYACYSTHIIYKKAKLPFSF